MKEVGLTKQERNFVTIMRFFSLVYGSLAILFVFVPDWILTYLTNIGIVFFQWRTRIPEFHHDHFWFIPTIAFLLTLSYAAYLSSRDLLRNMSFARVVVAGQGMTTMGFLIAAIIIEPLFVYLASAIVGGLFFLAAWYALFTARQSRPPA